MAVFPDGTLLHSGFMYSRKSFVLRSDMESGPAKQALRSSRDYIRFPVTYRFTAAEFTAFQTWVRDTVNKIGWFDWTEPLSETVKQTRIVSGDISDAKPLNPQMEEWLVTMEMETLD